MEESIEKYMNDGWKLSEFVNWISEVEKDHFFSMIGNGNVIVLNEENHPSKRKWKARMLISPGGLQILNLYFLPAVGSA